jgi:hypothetical protein
MAIWSMHKNDSVNEIAPNVTDSSSGWTSYFLGWMISYDQEKAEKITTCDCHTHDLEPIHEFTHGNRQFVDRSE